MPTIPYTAEEFIELLKNTSTAYEQYKADLAAQFEQYKADLLQILASSNPPYPVTVTLTADGWDGDAKTQTVAAKGILESETAQLIIPTPALADQSAYIDAGIRATGQGKDSITFTAEEVPDGDLTVHLAVITLAEVGS